MVIGPPELRMQALGGLVGSAAESASDLDRGADVQIRSLQLDTDPEPEYIIRISFPSPPITTVVIADRQADGWYAIGTFQQLYRWEPEKAEKIVETLLPFIIIREWNGGAGMANTIERLYRMREGQLYKVFEAQSVWEMIPGTLESKDINREIKLTSFYAPKSESVTALRVIMDEKHILYDQKRQNVVRTRAVSHTCEAFEWVPQSFEFRVTDRVTNAVCAGVSEH